MTLVVPNASLVIMLKRILNMSEQKDFAIRLFANDYKPNSKTIRGHFKEVNGGGYKAKKFSPGHWKMVANQEDMPVYAEYQEMEWSFDEPIGEVYGYFVTQLPSSELVWAERFENGPYRINTVGDKIKITPRLTLERQQS